MSDLDKDAFAAAYQAYQEIDCSGPGEPCNASSCQCLETMVAAYIAHIAASPADLHAFLAYGAGLAEGERVGLERAAAELEMSAQTIRLHAGELSAEELRAVQAVLSWKRAAIRALITKEPTT